MAESPVMYFVGARCRPEDEARFNKWYNEMHVPMLMKFRGMKGAGRFKLTSEGKDSSQYLAIYYFDSREDYEAFLKSPERAAAQAELRTSWPGGLDITWRADYELIKRWGETI